MDPNQPNDPVPESYNPRSVISDQTQTDYPVLGDKPVIGKVSKDEPFKRVSLINQALKSGASLALIVMMIAIPVAVIVSQQQTQLQSQASETTSQSYTLIPGSTFNNDGPATNFTINWVGTGENSTNSFLGLIFTGDPIPSNSIITNARIEFAALENSNEPLDLEVRAVLNFSPREFSLTNLPQNAILSKSISKITVTEPWEKDRYYSIEITEAVRSLFETVEELKSDIAVVIKGNSNQKSQRLIHTRAPLRPQLIIRYSLPE